MARKRQSELTEQQWAKIEPLLSPPPAHPRGRRVPRSRQGSYAPMVFRRYQRRSAEVDDAICEMFLQGVSTRCVGGLLEVLRYSPADRLRRPPSPA
jgi:transposase